MNSITVYFIQIATTFVICLAAVIYLRRSLRRVLVDLCATEDRAQFWMSFASIVLVGFPLVLSMGFSPIAILPDKIFFEAANQVKSNLFGFLAILIIVGSIITFFALIAPRPAVAQKEGA
jgi:hypothetical protein